MKKALILITVLIIAVAVSIGAFYGITNSTVNNGEYPLTLEELNAINKAWSVGSFAETVEEVGYLSGIKYVYAKYENCIVLGSSNMTGEYSECTVLGYLFKFPRNHMNVYSNGKIFKLTEAYDNGLLTDSQIKELWELHNACILKNDDYLVTETELAAINQLWGEKRFAENIGDIEFLGGTGAFIYGRFNGCIVLGKYGDIDDIGEYSVANYDFAFVDTVLKVYKSGKLYSLSDAYNDELLSDDNIAKIYELHCTRILRSDSVITSKLLNRINRLWSGKCFADKSEDVVFRQKANSFVYAYYNNEEIIVLGKTSIVVEDSEFTVAGYTFKSSDIIIKVYCDGELFSLEEIYSRGLVTENQIRELFELNTRINLQN